jgi:hypothetical protein
MKSLSVPPQEPVSAPGGDQLSPPSQIPASQSDACQASAAARELLSVLSTCSKRAGGELFNRRSLMTMMVSTIAGSVFVPKPSEADDSKWRDLELQRAYEDLQAADAAITALHKDFGDEADSREDYGEEEELRDACIEALISQPAWCIDGLQSKASALLLRVMIEDYDSHQQIACSLAEDIVRLGSAALMSQSPSTSRSV